MKEEKRSSEVSIETRTVVGYAALFDTPSSGLPWVETIDRNAFDGIIETSDVFAYLDHDKSRGVLARSKNGVGSLKLSVDEKGLRYEFEAPNTALGNELIEAISRRDITESSFAFVVGEHTLRKEGETVYRTINKIKSIHDVSPVYQPAYEGTDVTVRSLDGYSVLEPDLTDYYNNLKNRYLND